MTTIAHSVLAGTEIHEPKGVADASLGQVYVADGNGSGNWAGVGTSSFTGMIADFTWPVVQDGWLECDGSDINTTTYSALYDVMTIQQTGTRVISTATITSLSSTTNMRVGYYVFGTGIASGTTILSIDSGTQITLSGNVSSSGTATVVVSPWLLNTGTIRLPDLMDVSVGGRYRRTKRAAGNVGTLLGSTNLAHTHSVSGNTGNDTPGHSHNYSGTTGGESVTHTHTYDFAQGTGVQFDVGGNVAPFNSYSTQNVGANSTDHTHNYSGTSGLNNSYHTHSISLTSGSTGDSTESRPVSMTVMTCVKT